MDWEHDIKRQGSDHYKTTGVEPIDLLRDVKPHPSLTVLEVKALADDIKYAFRMLTQGSNAKDCGKIKHYTSMVEYCVEQKQPTPGGNQFMGEKE